ncbi:hypothetical protein ES706_00026 [subsurface metagenome]|nr:hypothetical protein [Hadesarchaea archaeon]
MVRKLIIVSASSRILDEPEPLPALERYDGIFLRTLRKYLREGKLRDTDIIIVSRKFGVIKSNDMIPYHEPYHGKFGEIGLDESKVQRLREKNLNILKGLIARGKYSEIYLNMGYEHKKLISGFENFVKCKITYAFGRGLGPKAQHMKNWILSQKPKFKR